MSSRTAQRSDWKWTLCIRDKEKSFSLPARSLSPWLWLTTAAFKVQSQPSRNTEELASGWLKPHHNELTNPLNIYLIRPTSWGETGQTESGRERGRQRVFNWAHKGWQRTMAQMWLQPSNKTPCRFGWGVMEGEEAGEDTDKWEGQQVVPLLILRVTVWQHCT